MTYMQTGYTVLATDLGRFLLWSNGQRTTDDGRTVDTFGIRTEHDHNLPLRGAETITADDVDSFVTVNRVQWHFHGFGTLDLTTGEILTFGEDSRTQDARRVDWKDAGWESRTKAETKIRDAIRGPLTEWAQSDDGRAFLMAARFANANNDRDSLTEKIAKLDAERAELAAQARACTEIMTANLDAAPAPTTARNPFRTRGPQA